MAAWPASSDAAREKAGARGAKYAAALLRGDQEPTHIYEIRLDGTGLRQLTSHPYWSDFEPTYCANGDIAFASDRSGRSSECGKFSADHTVINLYAISPDGTNLRRLSDNKDIDRYPHSLDNGLIAYTRWDYQERHFFETHAIWTVRPDGTMSDAVANQHMKFPFALRDTRSVPGSPKLVSIATGHHTLAYGPVVVVDPRRGITAKRGRVLVSVSNRLGGARKASSERLRSRAGPCAHPGHAELVEASGRNEEERHAAAPITVHADDSAPRHSGQILRLRFAPLRMTERRARGRPATKPASDTRRSPTGHA